MLDSLEEHTFGTETGVSGETARVRATPDTPGARAGQCVAPGGSNGGEQRSAGKTPTRLDRIFPLSSPDWSTSTEYAPSPHPI
eukprot:251924-Prorocentrum_minimum.AAC.1